METQGRFHTSREKARNISECITLKFIPMRAAYPKQRERRPQCLRQKQRGLSFSACALYRLTLGPAYEAARRMLLTTGVEVFLGVTLTQVYFVSFVFSLKIIWIIMHKLLYNRDANS